MAYGGDEEHATVPPAAAAEDAIETVLGELERQRRDRWIVAAILVLAAIAALGVALWVGAGVGVEPWVVAAFLAVATIYAVSVVVEERRARRAVRGLLTEWEHLAALEARITALETLHAVVRDVGAARDLPGVFERVLHGAMQLTGAPTGAVLLRTGDAMTVAASDGPGAPELGHRVDPDDGAAWEAVRSGTARVIARGAEWGMVAGASALAAPLHLPEPDRIVGALVVERGADAPPFAAADRLVASLLAQQAALAVRNASWLDRAGERGAALEREREELGCRLGELVETMRGRTAAISGTVQLLLHRGDTFPVARRHALLEDLLEDASQQRELLDRIEQLAAPPPER